MNLEQLKYPIGNFEYGKKYSSADTRSHIKILDKLPQRLKALTAKLTDSQLDTPYRPDGWTVRQVVHHIADSHVNMFIRIRLALTENNPTVKGYNEADWALLPDHKMPIKPSLQIIEGLHKRMVFLLKSLEKKDFKKTYYHAGYQRSYEIREVLALYAWHSEHHYQHIIQALK
jgi:DinB superfamily